jgi:single-strand DNA-binding protein
MASMNKVILIGRLGKDPDSRTTQSGTKVSSFSVATDQYRPGNGNDNQHVTDWHRVVAFGKTAELCNQFLRKGRLVCVEGSMQTRSWEKPPGERHFMTEVIAQRVEFLDPKERPAGGPESPAAEEPEAYF